MKLGTVEDQLESFMLDILIKVITYFTWFFILTKDKFHMNFAKMFRGCVF